MSLARTVAVTTVSLVAGRIVALLAGIGATAIASRYLGLDGFGALTLAMAIVSLLALLTDLGMSTMAVREIARAPQLERRIVGNVRTLGLAFSACASVLLVGIAEVAYADQSLVRHAILILSVQLLTSPLLSSARAHLQARQLGPRIALGDVALALAMFGASAGAAAADLGFEAMVAAVSFGYLAQAVTLTALMRPDTRWAWNVGRKSWRVLLVISLPFGATVIVNYLYFRLDVVLLSLISGTRDVAVYGLAYRVLEGLMVLPSYFMFALFPEIARLAGERERVDGIVRAALATMEALALPLVLFFFVFAGDVVRLIGGGAYADAAWVVRILMLALAISYLSGVYGHALPALGLQNMLFRWSLVVLGVNLAVNLALIPSFDVIGAAMAVVISEAVAFAVVRHLYSRAGTPPKPRVNPRMMLAGALMVAAVAPMLLFGDDAGTTLAALALGSVVGSAVYVLALLALHAVPEPIAVHLPRRILTLGKT
jgi:O-antigen/teichoic acid export membrane protein